MKASGVILAGGKSSRMKYNKAFAKIAGQTVISIIVDKFNKLFDEVLIISNEAQVYSTLGPSVYTDIYPRLGPVSGIHSGLYHSSYDKVFILGCDMPFINLDLVEHMVSRIENHDSVVPEIDHYLQPLAAVYSKKCLPVFQSCLENDRLKLVRIVEEELHTLVIPSDELKSFGRVEEIFLNVNDIEALETAKRAAGRYL